MAVSYVLKVSGELDNGIEHYLFAERVLRGLKYRSFEEEKNKLFSQYGVVGKYSDPLELTLKMYEAVLMPDIGQVHFHLAELYFKQGNWHAGYSNLSFQIELMKKQHQ